VKGIKYKTNGYSGIKISNLNGDDFSADDLKKMVVSCPIRVMC